MVQKRLEKSRKVNETRLEVQNHRNNLLEKVKEEFTVNLREEIKNKEKYKTLLRNLILQGLVMLMEEEVYVRVRNEDKDMVNDILKDIKKDFSKIIKEKLNEDRKVEVKMFPKDGLNEESIGGVILYCN